MADPRARLAPLAARLALAGASVLLVLLAAELGVRLMGGDARPLRPEALWRTQKAIHWPAVEGALRLGGVDYREEELDPALFEPGVTRVLMLGDSFTEGAGVPRRGDRFSDRLEARLDGERPERVHVFNAGVGGSVPSHWEYSARVLLPLYRPRAVLAVFFLRDGTRLPSSLAYNRRMVAPIRDRWESMPGYGVSALARRFYDRAAWREYGETYLERMRSSYLGTPAEKAFWVEQQGHLRRIAELCRNEGLPFHLVIFPILFDLDAYAFHDVEDEIARFAREAGIPVFSLTPGFLGREAASLWVASNDQHPNSEGHRIAAETLHPLLVRVLDALGEAPTTDRAGSAE